MNRWRFDNVVFRVDSSINIGSGHLMRCLTLADTLSLKGICCIFLTRNLKGNLIELIRQKGHKLFILRPFYTEADEKIYFNNSKLCRINQTDDAYECCSYLNTKVDWIIVDHYSLDVEWEKIMSVKSRLIMAIDDIANRLHFCDVILDQNFVSNYTKRYDDLVDTACVKLLGPHYALIRPEFAQLRQYSISRRKYEKIQRILVFMSGGDVNNETAKVIEGFKLSKYYNQHIDIIITANYDYLDNLINIIQVLPNASIHIQTEKMAELMASADFAITAGGSITWEKCVLGLPSIVSIMAENQSDIANRMNQYGTQITLGLAKNLTPVDYATSINNLSSRDLKLMSSAAIAICDGCGVQNVIEIMEELS